MKDLGRRTSVARYKIQDTRYKQDSVPKLQISPRDFRIWTWDLFVSCILYLSKPHLGNTSPYAFRALSHTSSTSRSSKSVPSISTTFDPIAAPSLQQSVRFHFFSSPKSKPARNASPAPVGFTT